MTETAFKVQGDYHVPLLKLLSGLPNGQGQAAEVLDLFWKRYRDGIPQAHRAGYSSGENIWANKVRWCRSDLTKLGLMDSPGHGIWRITQQGREWLARNPQAARIPNTQDNFKVTRPHRPAASTAEGKETSIPAGITLEMLEETQKTMSPDAFRRVWGTHYDRLIARERAKSVTQISDRALLVSVRRPLKQIQDFLLGQGNHNPASEEICDWIHFCYTLALYREVWALFQYVKIDEVSPWQYQDTHTISLAAKSNLDGGNLE